MKRLSRQEIQELETIYEGITEEIEDFEKIEIPPCPQCGSTNTALVQVGYVGRLGAIAAATSKVSIVMNLPKPGKYRCRFCKTDFDD